jgi:uncharacterized membrane protein
MKRYDIYDGSNRKIGTAVERPCFFIGLAVVGSIAIGWSLPYLIGLALPTLARLLIGWVAVFVVWWIAATALTGESNPSAATAALKAGRAGRFANLLNYGAAIAFLAVLVAVLQA